MTGWTGKQIDIRSGKTTWSRETGVIGHPVVFGDVTLFNHIYHTRAVNNKTGEDLWSLPGRLVLSHPSPSEGVAYLFSKTETHAVEAKTGKVLWTYPRNAETTAVLWQNLVSLDSESGSVVTLDRKSGKKRWEVPGKSISSDGHLLYCAQENGVVALDAKGKEVWRRSDLHPFELRGTSQGVLFYMGDPVASGLGDLKVGTVSAALSCKDGSTLYEKPAGYAWIGPWNEEAPYAAVSSSTDDTEVVEPRTGKVIWQFSGAYKDVDLEGSYLLRRKLGKSIEVLELKTGKILLSLPIALSPISYLAVARSGPFLYMFTED